MLLPGNAKQFSDVIMGMVMTEKIDVVLEAELMLLIEKYGKDVVYEAFMEILRRDYIPTGRNV